MRASRSVECAKRETELEIFLKLSESSVCCRRRRRMCDSALVQVMNYVQRPDASKDETTSMCDRNLAKSKVKKRGMQFLPQLNRFCSRRPLSNEHARLTSFAGRVCRKHSSACQKRNYRNNISSMPDCGVLRGICSCRKDRRLHEDVCRLPAAGFNLRRHPGWSIRLI